MKFPWWILILWILFIMGLFPVFISIRNERESFPMMFPKFFEKLHKASEINVFFNYVDTANFGEDFPTEGLSWTLYDGLNIEIVSGITDSFGMFSFPILQAYDESGLGIHIIFDWQGITMNINNLMAGDYEQELANFGINSNLYWSDMTPLPYMPIDLWFNGQYLNTIGTEGILQTGGLVVGNYTLKNTLFIDYNLTIELTQLFVDFAEDIIVTAKLILKSSRS